jgi:hypothetical protein
MKRRLTSALFILFGLVGLARPARAQYLGNVGLQTVNPSPFNSTCTGSPQLFALQNIGQTAHYLTLFAGTNLGGFTATIQGSQDGISFVIISDVLTQVNAGITAHGYYPVLRANVTCAVAGGTFKLNYSGESVVPGAPAGSTLQMTVDKNIAIAASAASTFTSVSFSTPFGGTSGTLVFAYSATGPSGSTLTVNCINLVSTPSAITIGPFALQTGTQVQTFPISASVCPLFNVTYTSGGASAALYVLDYMFSPPGFTPNVGTGTYTHITGTTATAVKATQGFLHSVTVNTGAAGTISVFDLPSASCTGTPSTSVVAVITVTTTTLQTFTYDTALLQGICVKASAGMDFTVSSN